MLFLVAKCDNVWSYKACVLNETQEFLENNLKLQHDTVKKLLQTSNLVSCLKFLHYGHSGEQLMREKLVDYECLWLHKNKVTILQDDNTLRFNFPAFGSLLINLIRNVLDKVEKQFFYKLIDKEASVRGFILEWSFFHIISCPIC